jgi:glycosyltransferase involved in cell wall biosynthesis
MQHATRLLTNSHYSHQEAQRNAGLPPERVHVVYHGVPDVFGALTPLPAKPIVLTVGNVDQGNLWRKGHLPFAQAAVHVPDLEWVLVGAWKDHAIDTLRAHASPNVTFTNRVSDEALTNYYRRASVYVQASAHEGFGLAVAEAMLAGCLPVTTAVGSLPEVVGETGVFVAPTPAAIAAGAQTALNLPPIARARARERILTEFPLEKRRRGLWALVENALASPR